MTRPHSLEFTSKVKDAAAQRANGFCEKCGIAFNGKRPEFDHILPAALGGKPELPNCMVLCQPCHSEKTAKEDIPRIRKADRQRRAANGSKAAPKVPLKSRGFEPSGMAPRIQKQSLPPRSIYEDIP